MSPHYIKQYGFKAYFKINTDFLPPQDKSVFIEVQDTFTLPDGQDANVSC